MKILVYPVFIALLASCEAPADLELPARPPRLVINTVLVAGTDSTEVFLSLTRPGESNAPWATVPGATVRLEEEGMTVREAVEHAPGKYWLYHPIRAATRYKLVVEHPGHATAWGETTLPSLFEAGIDSTGGRFVVNRWRDTPGERNYYWLSYLVYKKDGSLGLPVEGIFTTSALADRFNQERDDFAEIPTYYSGYARVEDNGLSGQTLELSYLCYGRVLGRIPFILSVDRHLDAYLKATWMAWNTNRKLEDFPLFYEPAHAYTNVTGGAGIIASCVRVERKFLRDTSPAGE
jgi:hypothetical protein